MSVDVSNITYTDSTYLDSHMAVAIATTSLSDTDRHTLSIYELAGAVTADATLLVADSPIPRLQGYSLGTSTGCSVSLLPCTTALQPCCVVRMKLSFLVRFFTRRDTGEILFTVESPPTFLSVGSGATSVREGEECSYVSRSPR